MHPEWDFFIYNSEVFVNNSQNISGSHNHNYKGVPPGFLSLYDYNIDRVNTANQNIFPFVETNSTYKIRFRKDLNNLVNTRKSGSGTWAASQTTINGTNAISSSYKMSASITRQFLTTTAKTIRSPFGDLTLNVNHTSSTLKNIPSIFYGSEIKKGTVELNYYITGTLIATAKDENKNGQLFCTLGTGSVSGSIVGHVLYREGIILFPSSSTPSSTSLHASNIKHAGASSAADNPKWIYFGAGANDGITHDVTHTSASYAINFEGTTYKNTMTMFCHANKGELNYSNNPTFKMIEHSASIVGFSTSSFTYSDRETQIKNIASSSFYKGEDDFRKVTYISKVGVYDENDNLLMTVDLARPYRKEEDDDLTFKIKYDLL